MSTFLLMIIIITYYIIIYNFSNSKHWAVCGFRIVTLTSLNLSANTQFGMIQPTVLSLLLSAVM